MPAILGIYVDGVLITTINKTVTVHMVPQISDFVLDGDDYVKLTGSDFSLCIHQPVQEHLLPGYLDGGTVKNWDAALWTSIEPDNTIITLAVRTGNTPAADGSWIRITVDRQMEARLEDRQGTFNTRQHYLRQTFRIHLILQDVSFSCLAAFPVKLVDFRANAIGQGCKTGLDYCVRIQ